MLSVAGAVILLLLSLASLLERLRDDPALLGKRYQLTVQAGAASLTDLERVPGVQAVSERYLTDGLASFSLGQPVRLIGFPGDHTRFEAPPLASGRRVKAPNEAEVGIGLAETLGLREGSPLAVQLPSGTEARFRVVGLTRALDNDGRIAHVQPDRLVEGDPAIEPLVAVRLEPGADPAAVTRQLQALGARPQPVGGATTSNARFLGVLAGVLRVVAIVNAVICLYALIQALALLARERRQTVAVLRATGAGRREVRLLFTGAALAAAVPAAILAAVLEEAVLGPAAAQLAADYAELPLGAGLLPILGVTLLLVALAVAAASWMAGRAAREPVVAGLREE